MTNDYQAKIKETVAYFFNEKYNSYFGVMSYQLDENGEYFCGSPSGVYELADLKNANIPYMGVKKNRN